MAHVGGSALASVACTCSELRDIAHDQILWPSSVLEDEERLVSGSVEGCFDKFYSDAYPLILYDEVANTNTSKLP
ncbi:hypothetical protein NC652_028465 [Populus alba x Populus x berolinensis]|uniref:Uncharacterized protein n=1 Tax=Populus alba x Populus x berolinensis TaxID=444605 RepID=A0AAD6M7G1_9ROSI|nr:hypothetical protein NC652_028465 [Populus alba x Populus x berolinensis]KAJ6980351.1 hypothetical protein NC653_028227 [Populus alba x Populus x berolinensis]